jgi:hypothetical protein
MYGIGHMFDVGDEVEVLVDRTKQGEVWQRAIISQLAPYRGLPGYYVNYPDAKEQYECHGGWQPQHLVRAKDTKRTP